jgi:hypothetical protein
MVGLRWFVVVINKVEEGVVVDVKRVVCVWVRLGGGVILERADTV